MFADAPQSECLFVTGSLRFTRAAIGHALQTATETRFLLEAELIDTLSHTPLTASRLQQLLDDGTGTVAKTDTSIVETVALYPEELRVATPSIADHTDRPFAVVADDRQVADLTAAYGTLFEDAAPVDDRFADTGWRDVLAGIEAELGTAARDAFTTATDAADTVGSRRTAVSLPGLLCLVAAGQDCQQKQLGEVAEDLGLASRATITNAAVELEEAGLISREPVNVDRRGRPPKRLHLVDDTLEPVAYPDRLRD